jgi:hypothetical protein
MQNQRQGGISNMRFLFQPNWTKNKEIRANNKKTYNS